VTDTAVGELAVESNPLSEGLRQGRVPLPCVVVIFGATGDLTKRKLVPALYALAADGLLPPGFSIVGAGRTGDILGRRRGGDRLHRLGPCRLRVDDRRGGINRCDCGDSIGRRIGGVGSSAFVNGVTGFRCASSMLMP